MLAIALGNFAHAQQGLIEAEATAVLTCNFARLDAHYAAAAAALQQVVVQGEPA